MISLLLLILYKITLNYFAESRTGQIIITIAFLASSVFPLILKKRRPKLLEFALIFSLASTSAILLIAIWNRWNEPSGSSAFSWAFAICFVLIATLPQRFGFDSFTNEFARERIRDSRILDSPKYLKVTNRVADIWAFSSFLSFSFGLYVQNTLLKLAMTLFCFAGATIYSVKCMRTTRKKIELSTGEKI